MEMIFCPNCGKRSVFKRALGFGTFFMVLITFGLWLLMIPFYPVRCINCGLTRTSAHWENASRGGKIFIVCMWICIVLFVLHTMRDNTPRSTESPAQEGATPSAINPHESRLADLRKKKDGIIAQIAMEREMAKKLILDAANLSAQPFPDPDEHQFLLEAMDKESQRIAKLLESNKDIDAEIAQEEGEQPPNIGPTSTAKPQITSQPLPAPVQQPPTVDTQPTEPNPPAPPVEAAKPTSGVLCNGVISVPQNEELTFKNLPGERLKFTFDHNAWTPTITRQPDGTQSLVMRSIKPGIQTKCDMRWEIVQ